MTHLKSSYFKALLNCTKEPFKHEVQRIANETHISHIYGDKSFEINFSKIRKYAFRMYDSMGTCIFKESIIKDCNARGHQAISNAMWRLLHFKDDADKYSFPVNVYRPSYSTYINVPLKYFSSKFTKYFWKQVEKKFGTIYDKLSHKDITSLPSYCKCLHDIFLTYPTKSWLLSTSIYGKRKIEILKKDFNEDSQKECEDSQTSYSSSESNSSSKAEDEKNCRDPENFTFGELQMKLKSYADKLLDHIVCEVESELNKVEIRIRLKKFALDNWWRKFVGIREHFFTSLDRGFILIPRLDTNLKIQKYFEKILDKIEMQIDRNIHKGNKRVKENFLYYNLVVNPPKGHPKKEAEVIRIPLKYYKEGFKYFLFREIDEKFSGRYHNYSIGNTRFTKEKIFDNPVEPHLTLEGFLSKFRVFPIKVDPPTLVDRNGNFIWKDRNGDIHRDNDLPAKIYASGRKEWWNHAKISRNFFEPAIIDANHKEFWINGGSIEDPSVTWDTIIKKKKLTKKKKLIKKKKMNEENASNKKNPEKEEKRSNKEISNEEQTSEVHTIELYWDRIKTCLSFNPSAKMDVFFRVVEGLVQSTDFDVEVIGERVKVDIRHTVKDYSIKDKIHIRSGKKLLDSLQK